MKRLWQQSRLITSALAHLLWSRWHYLESEQLEEAIAAAKAIADVNDRLVALPTLAARLPLTLQTDSLLALIDAVGTASRGASLSAVVASVGLTIKLGGQGAVQDLFRAICDVSRWYR